jgi:multidrug efflux pump subunit AcrA (membrane-fusion protein)
MDILGNLKKHWLLALVGLGVIGGATVFFFQKFQPEPLVSIQLKMEPVIGTLTVTGEVKAHQVQEVSAPVTAQINKIWVDKGDIVVANQVVVSLEASDLLARQQEAQAMVLKSKAAYQNVVQGTRREEVSRLKALVSELTFAVEQNKAFLASALETRANAELTKGRYQQLLTQGAISQQEYDQVNTKFTTSHADVIRYQALIESSQAKVRQSKEQLSQALHGPTQPERDQASAQVLASEESFHAAEREQSFRTIRSSMPGVVISRDLEVGDVATFGKAILKIANFKTLEISASVQESDIEKVKPGAKAFILLDALPETPIEGTVRQIGSQVNPDNGSVEVIVALPKVLPAHSFQLMPGMTSDVNIITDTLSAAMTLPTKSVVIENGKYFVYAFVSENTVQKVPVQLRRITLENFLVLSGLKPKDWVVADATKKDAATLYLSDHPKKPVLEEKK